MELYLSGHRCLPRRQTPHLPAESHLPEASPSSPSPAPSSRLRAPPPALPKTRCNPVGRRAGAQRSTRSLSAAGERSAERCPAPVRRLGGARGCCGSGAETAGTPGGGQEGSSGRMSRKGGRSEQRDSSMRVYLLGDLFSLTFISLKYS